MTSPRSCKNKGSAIIDVMLASALILISMATVQSSNFEIRKLFDEARIRRSLIDSYEAGKFSFFFRKYGNTYTEQVDSVSTSTRYDGEISVYFSKIKDDTGSYSSLPYCSAYLSSDLSVGSFRYFSNNFQTTPDSILVKTLILPIDPITHLTDLEVTNDRMFVSADSADYADPDIYSFDISDSENIRMISSVNSGPGIASIAFAGKRIYAAASSISYNLHYFDLNDGVIKLRGKIKLDLPFATATPLIASSVAFANNRIFLGTEKWDGPEFLIFDSEVEPPSVVGNLEIGSKISDIVVDKENAFIASSNENQFVVLDISDAYHPFREDTFNPAGYARQDGRAVAKFESFIGLGRTSGGFNVKNEYELFVASSSVDLAKSSQLDESGGVYGIVMDRQNIYFITRHSGKEFIVAQKNLSADSLRSFALPSIPTRMTCFNDKIYVLSRDAPVVYEITIPHENK